MDQYYYEYKDDGDVKYCYPGTQVLVNKFDIHNGQQLSKVEREISIVKAAVLADRITGNFDLAHLKSIGSPPVTPTEGICEHSFISHNIFSKFSFDRVSPFTMPLLSQHIVHFALQLPVNKIAIFLYSIFYPPLSKYVSA